MIYQIEYKNNGVIDGGFFCTKHIIRMIDSGIEIISQKKCKNENVECESCIIWVLTEFKDYRN